MTPFEEQLVRRAVQKRLSQDEANAVIDEVRSGAVEANACSICGMQYASDHHNMAAHEAYSELRKKNVIAPEEG